MIRPSAQLGSTTHDPRGGGAPRLIFSLGGFTQVVAEQREFLLLPGITVIGSARDADLQLAGLTRYHAEIRRDDADEYHFFHLGSGRGSAVDGAPMGRTILRTGKRLQLNEWTLSYYREEFADHGRPYGGRVGGNNGYQRPQSTPRLRGTTSGQDRSAGDDGEYF